MSTPTQGKLGLSNGAVAAAAAYALSTRASAAEVTHLTPSTAGVLMPHDLIEKTKATRLGTAPAPLMFEPPSSLAVVQDSVRPSGDWGQELSK